MAAIVAKYLGKDPDEHYHGVPARDLTQEDLDALDPELRALVSDCRLYRMRGHAEPTDPTRVRHSAPAHDTAESKAD